MPISPTSGATIRQDVNVLVEEAALADSFFIGLKVMPAFGVDAKSGTYPKVQIAAGELLSAGSTVRSRGGAYGAATRQWTSDTYDCLDRGLEEPMDDADAKDLARFFNLETSTAKWVLRNMMLDHESRVAAAIQNTSNFSNVTTATAYTEANLATIPVVVDILAAIERVRDQGINPNTIVMSSPVYQRVRRTAQMLGFVQGSTGKINQVNANTIAQAFSDEGITQCLIGKARYNTAKKGQAKSLSPVWSNNYIWVGLVNPNPLALTDGGAGFTLVWNEEGGVFVTETYRADDRRCTIMRVRQNTAEKVVDSTAGTLITTTYS